VKMQSLNLSPEANVRRCNVVVAIGQVVGFTVMTSRDAERFPANV
jgi:hypothetical protein